MIKRTLLATFIILANPVFADTAVNDYDCSIDELKGYIEKKSEGLVQRKSAIQTWETFKKTNTRTAASEAGGISPNSSGKSEDCNYFWGDLDDITYNSGDLGSTIGDILSGNMSGIVDKAVGRITEVTDSMISEIKKGLCKRLSTGYVKKEVYNYGNKTMDSLTGYDIGDVTDPNLNGYINSALKNTYGSTGKLLNVFDPSIDSSRGRGILKESDRQMESILKITN